MQLHIGIAGWSYKDWEGIVYPERMKRQHPVEYLAQYFDLIEINTSFYGHLKPQLVKLWCRMAAAVNPDFLFTAKLHKSFTHSPMAELESTSSATIRPTQEDEIEARRGYDALAEAGRLGALLVQFPVSFKNTNENREYLTLLLRNFCEYPLAVEVRHASWGDQGTLPYFTEKGVAFCNIDQPLIGRALAPAENVTAALSYIRLHGRRYDQWFEAERPHDRYDYLYTEEELSGWKERIERVTEKSQKTFVVANNHFEGKAAVNALQLKSMISGKRVKAPEILVHHYPVLEKMTEREPSLFNGKAES